jgi:hypothetical protein
MKQSTIEWILRITYFIFGSVVGFVLHMWLSNIWMVACIKESCL